jgi:hypothetical protein
MEYEGRRDEVRHRDEMCLRQIACDAERSTDVLTMDQDVGESGDRPRSGRRFAVGGGVSKGLQNNPRVLLTAHLPVNCHPSVVVEAVAKHSPEDRAKSEGALRASGHMSKHVPDAPQGTQ